MTLTHRPTKFGLLAAALLSVALLIGACTNGDDANDASIAQLIGGMSDSQLEALARGTSFGGYTSANGIQTSGVGIIRVDPDIAIMSLGVETLQPTVTEARDEAATAIDAMITSLKAAGVDDDDLETQYYNIQPEYNYGQVTETLSNGQKVTRSERTLIGYRVTNTLSVTIRNLDNIGEVVDGAVTAGGDATRLNGISFTIDDGSVAEEQARSAALEDALAKATLYAEKLDATRGKLISVVETSGSNYTKVSRDEFAFDSAAGASAPSTQILAGSLEIRVTVQAVFAVD